MTVQVLLHSEQGMLFCCFFLSSYCYYCNNISCICMFTFSVWCLLLRVLEKEKSLQHLSPLISILSEISNSSNLHSAAYGTVPRMPISMNMRLIITFHNIIIIPIKNYEIITKVIRGHHKSI